MIYDGAAPFPLTPGNAAGHSFAFSTWLQVMTYPIGMGPALASSGAPTPRHGQDYV